jgi:hypothetical protein
MRFEVNKSSLIINNIVQKIPFNLTQIIQSIGNSYRIIPKTNNEGDNLYVWDNYGIICYTKDNETVNSITLSFSEKNRNEHWPKNDYCDEYLVNGKSYPFTKDKILVGDILITNFSIDDFCISSISLKEKKVKNSNKYAQPELTGEEIIFKDFNFKLAILQILMYDMDVLKPKFDFRDYLNNYESREINIDEEGYEFIPELVNYFSNYKIDKKYSSLITEITQDGGNEIYLQVIPFWDGEDDSFNIKCVEDAKHFPNLKKVTLFYENEPIVKNGFIKFGIDADYL